MIIKPYYFILESQRWRLAFGTDKENGISAFEIVLAGTMLSIQSKPSKHIRLLKYNWLKK